MHGNQSTFRLFTARLSIRRVIIGTCLALWVVAALFMSSAPALAQTTSYDIELYALEGDTLLYKASRTISQFEGKVMESTSFKTPDGKPVQEVVGTFVAETLAPLSYTLNDARSFQEETLVIEGEKVYMTYLEKLGEEKKTDTIDYKPGMLVISAVTPYIQRNWDKLAAGEKLPFRVMAASKLDSYQFRLMKAEGDKAGKAPEGGMVVRMEPDTWLVRAMVDPLYFVLEGQPPHRVVEFRGRSSVKTDEGEDQDLRYMFIYP